MITFRKLVLDDIPLVRPYQDDLPSRLCDYTVGTLFMWRNYFDVEIADTDRAVFTRFRDKNGLSYYGLPLAKDIPSAVETLLGQETGETRFCSIPECCLPIFEALDRDCIVEENEESFDYLYRAEDIVELKGKKYSPQRNLIHQFEKECERWRFVELDKESLPRVREYFHSFFPTDGAVSDSEREDKLMTGEVLEHFDRYGMFGAFLEADGKIVGFSLGEKLGDTLYTHIEKADRSRKGAYQMLVNQFARHFADESIRFINREDDMGDPGLRRAKHAYHPIELLKRYTVTVK